MSLPAVEVRTAFPNAIEVRTPVWIPLPDGTRLHAKIWLPVDADQNPVPAIIEYGPYRLTDGTVASDEQEMRWEKWIAQTDQLESAYENDVWNPKQNFTCKAWCPVLSCAHNGRK